MEYRTIGKTGISAGVVGLGCEHLAGRSYGEVEDVIAAALDNGVNILDVFMPGREVRQNIGRAVGKRRDKVLIQGHIGSTDLHEQNDVSRDPAVCKKYFESYLKDMGTDYIDFGMFFFVDTPEDFRAIFETELLGYARDLKQRGVIRAIGASSHNSVVARRIVESGEVDLIMFSVNPVFDMTPAESDIYRLFEMLDDETQSRDFGFRPDPDRAALYRVCAEREVGITVMKTLCAGKLLSGELSPFGAPMSAGQCVHYALTRPAVVSTLVGCKNRAEVLEALRYFDMSDEERDYSAVIEGRHRGFRGNCMYCNHCLPCPSVIDVASVHRYLDIASLRREEVPPAVRQHYLRLERHGSDCTACGSCEARCPFGVPVVRNMRRAVELFGA